MYELAEQLSSRHASASQQQIMRLDTAYRAFDSVRKLDDSSAQEATLRASIRAYFETEDMCEALEPGRPHMSFVSAILTQSHQQISLCLPRCTAISFKYADYFKLALASIFTRTCRLISRLLFYKFWSLADCRV